MSCSHCNCGCECDCSKCHKVKTIHRIKVMLPFSYTERYLKDAINPNVLYILGEIAVTVEGTIDEIGVVSREEFIREYIEKVIVKPWSFAILAYKGDLPVPPNLIAGSNRKVIVLDFIPSVEGVSNYVFHRVRRKIEKEGDKLVSVEVSSDFSGTFIGSCIADDKHKK